MQKNWDAIFKVKVTIRAYIITIIYDCLNYIYAIMSSGQCFVFCLFVCFYIKKKRSFSPNLVCW